MFVNSDRRRIDFFARLGTDEARGKITTLSLLSVWTHQSTTFFWNRHTPLPITTLVNFQAFHFPNSKGIKRVLCEIAIDVSFLINALCTFILVSNLLREILKVSMNPLGHFYM